MQRSRNIVWLCISYALVLGLVFDPTKILGPPGTQVSLKFNTETSVIILVSILLGLLINSNVFSAFGTFVHELGHSIAVGLTGGNVQALRMQIDTSGSTSWSGKPSRLTRALVAVAGPLANAIVFAATLSALHKGFSANALLLLAVVLSLITVTSIRNVWGWLVSLALIVSMIAMGLVLNGVRISQELSISEIPTEPALLAILVVVAFSAGNGLRYSWKCRNPKSADMDEHKFARALGLPAWFGGHFVLAINLLIVGYSLHSIASLNFGDLLKLCNSD